MFHRNISAFHFGIRKSFFVNYLKEDSFSVFALWTGMIFGPGEGRVSDDVSNDLGQLVDLVHDLVDVDAAAVRQLKETA
jgi:hypothetical protein